MEILMCFLSGILVSAAVYLMLSRNMVKFLFGLILLSNAVNITIFTAGRITQGMPAFVPDGQKVPPDNIANAVPQALILTAIVISFGLLSFALVLAYRAYQEIGSVDMDEIGMSQRLEETKNQSEQLSR